MSLKINKDRTNIDIDIQIVSYNDSSDASDVLTEYFNKQIAGAIDAYILKELTDTYIHVDRSPKNMLPNDIIEFDRYAIPSYVSIDYKDKKTPLIPEVL